ncbi:MAG: helix-turn-helix domain-containing protein [Pseudomonadota bacterium]
MTTKNLKRELHDYGLTQQDLADLLDVSPRTVSLWANDDKPLPGPVRAYFRLLGLCEPATRSMEFANLKGRNNMLDDGLYALDYAGQDGGEAQRGDALAVLRNGRILGSDRHGGTFSGSYVYDAGRDANSVHVRFQLPPDGELVNGITAGPQGSSIELTASFDRATPVTTTTIDLGGQPVRLQLTFVGPLPK